MGSWYHTDMVSRLHIRDNEEVVSFFMTESPESAPSLCYNTAMWHPIPIAIYGKYGDYGRVTDFSGPHNQMLIDYIRQSLSEVEQGENEYHDIAVTKDLISMNFLYEADHERRLYLRGGMSHFPGYRARLLCCHAVIKRSLYEHVINAHMCDEYVRSDSDKWGGHTEYFGISEVIAKIPDDLTKFREETKNDPLLAYGFSRPYLSDEARSFFALIPTGNTYIHDIRINDKLLKMPFDDAVVFATEIARFGWFNRYLSDMRCHWTPMTGAGSQSCDMAPYAILAQYLIDEVEKNRQEYDDDED
jgi:hypothetical protein